MSIKHVVVFAAVVQLASALHAPFELRNSPSRGLQSPSQFGMAKNVLSHGGVANLAATQRQELKALRGGGSTPLAGCVGSLIKNIVGSGVLALAGAVAAFSDDPAMIYPAIGIALVAGIMSAYCFALVGRTCAIAGAKTYREAWAKTVGESTAWLPAATCTFQTLAASVCYSIIIGDLSRDLAATAGVRGVMGDRTTTLTLTMASVVLPLCMLRSFGFLQYTSLLGISGTAYTGFFMLLRYFQGAYLPPNGAFAKAVAQPPVFGKKGTSAIKALILVSTLTTNYLAHYNAPKFLTELENPTTARFNLLTYVSFFGAFVLSVAFMASGFLTFGGASQGLILNNYAASDTLATFSRVGIAASIIFGFPLTFVGFRDNFLELIGLLQPSQGLKDALTIGGIIALTGVAMVVRDLGVVVSFFGALLGSAVIYVYPSIMFLAALKGKKEVVVSDAELYAQYGLIGAGTGLGALGAIVVILKTYTNILK